MNTKQIEEFVLSNADKMMQILLRGAFLTTKGDQDQGQSDNTMTVSWGNLGIMWGQPVCMVMVRDSRHTYGLIEKAGEFTLSFPTGTDEAIKAALAYCGTKSGRDGDKFTACGLSTKPGVILPTPIIDCPGYHLECEILYRTPMQPQALNTAEDAKWYASRDYHTLYFAGIRAAYML